MSHNQIMSINININAVQNFCNNHYNVINSASNVSQITFLHDAFTMNKIYILLTHDGIYHYVKVLRMIDRSMVIGIYGKGIMTHDRCEFAKHEICQYTFLNLTHFASTYLKYFNYEEPLDTNAYIFNDINYNFNNFNNINNIVNNARVPITNNARVPVIVRESTINDEEVKDNNNYAENITCNICLTNKVAICYIPCGHTSCGTCSKQITKCQTCRIVITKKINLFI